MQNYEFDISYQAHVSFELLISIKLLAISKHGYVGYYRILLQTYLYLPDIIFQEIKRQS